MWGRVVQPLEEQHTGGVHVHELHHSCDAAHSNTLPKFSNTLQLTVGVYVHERGLQCVAVCCSVLQGLTESVYVREREPKELRKFSCVT